MKTKNIGYAYASSDIAQYMGFSKTGCYFVTVYDDSKPMKKTDVVFASENKEKVQDWALNIKSYPYGTYSMELVSP